MALLCLGRVGGVVLEGGRAGMFPGCGSSNEGGCHPMLPGFTYNETSMFKMR
jgi:hypothetical protein